MDDVDIVVVNGNVVDVGCWGVVDVDVDADVEIDKDRSSVSIGLLVPFRLSCCGAGGSSG